MLPLVAIAEMYALKILIGVLSGEKPRGGARGLFPCHPSSSYSGIHFCKTPIL